MALRRTRAHKGAFVLYDRLRVDWRQFFSREDSKLIGEDRLTEAILSYQRAASDAAAASTSAQETVSNTDELFNVTQTPAAVDALGSLFPDFARDGVAEGGEEFYPTSESSASKYVGPVTDSIYDTSLAAWRYALERANGASASSTPAPHQTTAKEATPTTATAQPTASDTSSEAELLLRATKSDRLVEAATHMSRYLRIALEDNATIESIPRRLGEPLSAVEASELSQLFTEVHSLDQFAKLLLHLTEDLGHELTSKHYHALLRLFIFGKDKSCCDRTLEAIVRNGFVSEETFARMIDAHHIFAAPAEALRHSLALIHTQSVVRRESVVVGVDGLSTVLSSSAGVIPSSAEVATSSTNSSINSSNGGISASATASSSSVPSSSATIRTSHTLSSLLHHLSSSGSHHTLLTLVTVVWMRALGVELSNWDWSHVVHALTTRPQDYQLVKGVMEAMEIPPPPAAATADVATASSPTPTRRLASGYVSIHSLLYCLHREGVLSNAGYARLRAHVRQINSTLNDHKSNRSSNGVNIGGGGAFSGSQSLSSFFGQPPASESVYVRVRSLEGKKASLQDDDESPAFLQRLHGASRIPSERVRPSMHVLPSSSSSSSTAVNDLLGVQTEDGGISTGGLKDRGLATEMSHVDLSVHQALGHELEALLLTLIQNVAAEMAIGTSTSTSKSNVSSLTPFTSDSVLIHPSSQDNAFISVMKSPIHIGFLNRRHASPKAMVLSLLEQATTQHYSVGPFRENGANLYHYYALLLCTTRKHSEALKMLAEVERVGNIWESLYGNPFEATCIKVVDADAAAVETVTSPLKQKKEGHRFLLADAVHLIASCHHRQDKADSIKNEAGGGGPSLEAKLELARRVFGPRAVPIGANQHAVACAGVDKALGAPFVIGPHFLFDLAMVMPEVPFTYVASLSGPFMRASTRLKNAVVTHIESSSVQGLTPSHESSQTLEEGSADTSSQSSSPQQPPAAVKSIAAPLLKPNDKAFLTAYGMYFVRNTAEANAAWQTITHQFEELAGGHEEYSSSSSSAMFAKKLPPRSVKKMIKVYAEICARNPPRNCKLTQKGYEERLRWALYLESRETALMLYGSGQEAKDMMKHLYYNENKLPVVRTSEKIASDEARLLPLLITNPIGDTHALQQRILSVQREALSAHSDGLAKTNVDDSRVFAQRTLANHNSSDNHKGDNAVDLKTSVSQSAFYSPSRPTSTGLEEVAEVTLTGVSKLGGSATTTAIPSNLSYSAQAQVNADGRLLEPFATVRSWVHGYQNTLVPSHLYREDVFNHFPHVVLANRGAISHETVTTRGHHSSSSPQHTAAGSEADTPLISVSAGFTKGSNNKRGSLVFSSSSNSSGSSAHAANELLAHSNVNGRGGGGAGIIGGDLLASYSSTGASLLPARAPFVYADALIGLDEEEGGFSEDPFVPLWSYINELFSVTDLTRERPWVFEDTEMFLLILKSLIYRLDWENATKFVLLLTQTSPLNRKNNADRVKLSGYAETLQQLGINSSSDDQQQQQQGGSMHPEWTFALDHATADMFDAIGDPQGFLPFKTATKLFDGRLVNKSNRMGRVSVKPLMDAAGVKEDESEHGDSAKKRRFV